MKNLYVCNTNLLFRSKFNRSFKWTKWIFNATSVDMSPLKVSIFLRNRDIHRCFCAQCMSFIPLHSIQFVVLIFSIWWYSLFNINKKKCNKFKLTLIVLMSSKQIKIDEIFLSCNLKQSFSIRINKILILILIIMF